MQEKGLSKEAKKKQNKQMKKKFTEHAKDAQ